MGQGTPQLKTTGYDVYSDPSVLDDIADRMALELSPNAARPKVVVTIPAQNEEGYIEKCLTSLAMQRTVLGAPIDTREFEIIVLCHKCTDGTANSCHKIKSEHPELNLFVLETDRPEVNNVGAVRRILMQVALSRIFSPLGYIATTDADTVIHPYWMANLLGYVGSGYGLIGGRIGIDTQEVFGSAKRVLALKTKYDRWRLCLEDRFVSYTWDPVPRHSHNSGPNMAVRADVYHSVGGMPPIAFCEDVAFYDEVVWGGHRIRHCPWTLVTTSGRVETRVPWGFGAELRVWGESNTVTFEVEGLDALLERFALYALAGKYLASPATTTFEEIVDRSGIERQVLLGYLEKFGTHRALVHKLEKDLDQCKSWRERYPKKLVSLACDELKNYLWPSPADLLQT